MLNGGKPQVGMLMAAQCTGILPTLALSALEVRSLN